MSTHCNIVGASLVTQMVKNLPAIRDTWARSLGWGDPLEKEMSTHSGILAWGIPWTEEPGGLQSMGLQRVGRDWVTNTFLTQKVAPNTLLVFLLRYLRGLSVSNLSVSRCWYPDVFYRFLKNIFSNLSTNFIFGHGLFEVCCFLNIYLASLGLNCGMGDLVPHQGSNLGSLHWEHRIFTLDHQGSLCRFISECVYQIFVILLNS